MPEMKDLQRLLELSVLSVSQEEEAALLLDLQRAVRVVSRIRDFPAEMEAAGAFVQTADDLRADRAYPSLSPEEALGNAGDTACDCFCVPKML